MKTFSDIAPEMQVNAKDVQRAISKEIVTLIVQLSQNRTLITPDKKNEAIYQDLKRYVGGGLVCNEALKLAVALGLLCQELADGKKKNTIHAYLDYLVALAVSLTGAYDRDLLRILRDMVKNDMLNSRKP